MPLETLTMRPQPRLTIPSSNAGQPHRADDVHGQGAGPLVRVDGRGGSDGRNRRGIVHHDVDVFEGGLCLRGDERGGVRIADVGPDLHGPAPGRAHVGGGYVQKFLANGVGCSRFACGLRSSA
jgi:hypothetical protein